MKKILKMLMVMMLTLSLTSCKITKSKIAYTVYPIGFIIHRLTNDSVASESIQTDGIVQRATLKDNYQEILDSSAGLIHIGNLEPYLPVFDKQIQKSGIEKMDLSALNAVYDFQRYTEVFADGKSSFFEGPYYVGDVFKIIDHDTKDLYLWTDPIVMLSMSKNIRDWLVSHYPDEKAKFEENFKKLETDLINLDAQYQTFATSNRSGDKQVKVVTMTASFGNWQKTYGIQVYPVVLSKYGVLPTSEQLELIKQRIKQDQVKYIAFEPNMPQDMVDLFNQLSDELGLTRVELNNLSSLTQEQAEQGKDYLSLMYENLSSLQTMVELRNQPVTDGQTNTTHTVTE